MRWLWGLALLFLGTGGWSQSVLNQRLDFSADKESPIACLMRLSEESGVAIAFSNRILDGAKEVSLDREASLLRDVLQQILRGTRCGFREIGGEIIVFRERQLVSGYVLDQTSSEALVAATVYIPGQRMGTYTNEYGFFSLEIPAELDTLQVQYIGYETQRILLPKDSDAFVQLRLKPDLKLEDVVIVDRPESRFPLPQAPDGKAISLDLIQQTPTIGGESDLIRTAQLLPGIQSGVDGTAGLFVRGGDAGHNMMLLDGATVYIPYHLLGIYSIYNSNSIKSARVLKGGYSARYGGRLAGIMDVRTREGNLHQYKGEVSANLINGRLTAEGPIQKDKSAFLLTGRITNQTLLLNPFFDRTYHTIPNGTQENRFQDLFGKVNFKLSDRDRIYLSGLYTKDEFGKESNMVGGGPDFSSETEVYWNNAAGTIRWNHLFNEQAFINTRVTYSFNSFQFSSYDEFAGTGSSYELYFTDNRSRNHEVTVGSDLDWNIAPGHTLRAGGGITRRTFETSLTYFDQDSPEIDSLTETNPNTLSELINPPTEVVGEAFAYLEDDIRVGEHLTFRPGLRGSYFQHPTGDHFRLEPRFTLAYLPSKRMRFHLSGSRMVQYLHFISNTSIRFPNDLWLPSTDELPPQESWQAELGGEWAFGNHWDAQWDVYYRLFDGLLSVPEGTNFIQGADLSSAGDFLLSGSGRAYGSEWSLNYQSQGWVGHLAYTLARTERTFPGTNLGLTFPQDFDRQHQFNVMGSKRIGKRWETGVVWSYASANPRQELVSVERGLGLTTILPPPGTKNSVRSEPNHRLDLTLTMFVNQKNFLHRFQVSLYNVYNRSNIAYFLQAPGGIGAMERVASLGFTPGFSYTLTH